MTPRSDLLKNGATSFLGLGFGSQIKNQGFYGGVRPNRSFRTEFFGCREASNFDSCIPTRSADAELEQNFWQPDQAFSGNNVVFFHINFYQGAWLYRSGCFTSDRRKQRLAWLPWCLIIHTFRLKNEEGGIEARISATIYQWLLTSLIQEACADEFPWKIDEEVAKNSQFIAHCLYVATCVARKIILKIINIRCCF